MSGDVQPRKRKDKKRKKDELGLSEPRGTAAALGDGDVFMHSHHDHGTGGHWCAKVIFFSLLAILIGLVGLIILENRGLSELEANAVQSQYSGVLEGWLEDAPEDDHHDEHTLELTHHDEENDADHGEEIDDSGETDVDEHDEDNNNDDDQEENNDNEHDEEETSEELQDEETGNDSEENQSDEDEEERDNDGSQEQDIEANDEEDLPYKKYYHGNKANPNNEDDNDDDDDDDEDDNDGNDDEEQEDYNIKDNDEETEKEGDLSYESDHEDNNNDDDDDSRNLSGENIPKSKEDDDQDNAEDSQEHNKDEDEHEDEEDTSLEVEKIEHEASEDEDPISTELPALPEPSDDNDDDDNNALESVENDATEADDDDTVDEPDNDYLEADDDEPPIERITAPAGKPFTEVEEEEESTEKPTDTLAEEEEYEKRQEELRREEAQASHMWLKLSIGGALLVATHAIVRRATASSDVPQTEQPSREEAPATDRRMTLIAEEPSEPVSIRKVTQESTRPVIQDVSKQIPSIVKSSPTFEESEDEVEEEEEPDEPIVSKVVHAVQSAKQAVKEESYSDEEEAEDEETEEEEKVVEKKVALQVAKQPAPEPEPDEDVPDDVEIIDDEQIEEEAEEEVEDEEEISDVDDEELLTRLEAKYGRLPEPERPPRHKDGGNSIEDDWPGEPSDAYWRQQLDQAEREFDQGAWLAAADRASAEALRPSARARLLVAQALDAAAEHQRDNVLLGRSIAAYLELLKMNERLPDEKLLQVAERTINRIQFRGTYLNAEPVYKLLIRRFPDDSSHRTNLTVTFLMANRADLAEEVLKETLKRWPDDRLALAQYGFVLKTQHNRLEEAAKHLLKALEGDTGPATEPRFYYHLGDTLLLLGRFNEAHEVHKRAAAHGHFLSPAQRSLYNVPRLTGRPWWNIEDTPYVKLVRTLEKSWREILKEGEAAKELYEQEKEGLKERGEWTQLDLFVRGREIPGRCARAPATCAAVRGEARAAGCRRGQVKFSAMAPGTRVRPHTGPTNCRLRLHLGLSNTKHTFIRVDQETRQWEEGKVFIFDDSFEHEVWHNGTGTRLVLIVDVWHPELTPAERRQLPAI